MSSPVPVEGARERTPASAANESACGSPSLLITPTTRTRSPAAVGELLEHRHLLPAGRAPAAPEVDDVGTPGARPRSSGPRPGSRTPPQGSDLGRPRPAGRAARGTAQVGGGRRRGGRRRGGRRPRPPAGRAGTASRTTARASAATRANLTRCPRPRVLTSFSADLGIDRPDAVRRAPRASPQAPQAAFLAWQTRRPWKITRWLKLGPLLLRDQLGDLALDLDRVGLLGPRRTGGPAGRSACRRSAPGRRRRCPAPRWRSCGPRRAA